MRSQDADESKEDLVPDWALLEVCKVGVGGLSAPVRVNVNSVADSLLTPPNALSAGLARVPSVASILGGMTTQNAPTARIGGKPLNLPTVSGFSEAVGTPAAPGYLRVATNLATLNFTDAWSNRRKGGKLKNAHPAAAYALGAEVLEVKGVSDFSQDDAANEGRALGVFESFTTKSEVFTVYSVGYAVDKNDRVVSESLVRAQVARDPATGRFRLIFAEPLSWPP